MWAVDPKVFFISWKKGSEITQSLHALNSGLIWKAVSFWTSFFRRTQTHFRRIPLFPGPTSRKALFTRATPFPWGGFFLAAANCKKVPGSLYKVTIIKIRQTTRGISLKMSKNCSTMAAPLSSSFLCSLSYLSGIFATSSPRLSS